MKQSPFRSIRQKLFNEGKLLRYLGYALGEILLIIVGIMLALQLNNWNEDRKAQAEFDLYLVQLREDVRTAIYHANGVVGYNNGRVTNGMKAIQALTDPDFESEDMTAFEDGIQALGMYQEPHTDIGFLGQLMKGDMKIISRDRALALKAMKMQSDVNRLLASMIHIKAQIDINAGHLAKHRGRRFNDLGMPSRYDFQKLKASDEFINSGQTIVQQTAVLRDFTAGIVESLEEFLTALEKYDKSLTEATKNTEG